jgi:hypothetical protein
MLWAEVGAWKGCLQRSSNNGQMGIQWELCMEAGIKIWHQKIARHGLSQAVHYGSIK